MLHYKVLLQQAATSVLRVLLVRSTIQHAKLLQRDQVGHVKEDAQLPSKF